MWSGLSIGPKTWKEVEEKPSDFLLMILSLIEVKKKTEKIRMKMPERDRERDNSKESLHNII